MHRMRPARIAGLLCASALLVLVYPWTRSDRTRVDTTASSVPHPSIDGSRLQGQLGSAPRQSVDSAPVFTTQAAEDVGGSCAPGTICGVVTIRGGQPCNGAVCNVFPGEPPQGMRFARGLRRSANPVSTCVSDAGGSFTLSAPAGYWTLKVEHPVFRTWQEDFVRTGSFR